MRRTAVVLVLLALTTPAWAQSKDRVVRSLDDHLRASVYPRANVVTAIENGSSARKAGVRKGDVLESYDGKPIAGPDDLAKASAAAVSRSRVELVVERFVLRKRKRKKMWVKGGKTGLTLAAPEADPKAAWRTAAIRSKRDADWWRDKLWDLYKAAYRANRPQSRPVVDKLGHGPNKGKPFDTHEVTAGGVTLTYGRHALPFDKKTGRPLSFVFHGGYNASYQPSFKKTNFTQYHTLQFSYKTKGRMIVPLADEGGWAVAYMCAILDQLIRDELARDGIDPNRVYAMGYSMGGFGTSYFGPLIADRFAALGMTSGSVYPHNAPLENLRNTPMIIQGGSKDEKLAPKMKEYAKALEALRAKDAKGYEVELKIHEGRPHHNVPDRKTTPDWLYQRERNPVPDRIVWRQDEEIVSKLGRQKHPGRDFSVYERVKQILPSAKMTSNLRRAFYWLRVATPRAGGRVVASRKGQEIQIQSADVEQLFVRLDDRMCNLGKPVTITWNGKQVFRGKVKRSLGTMVATLLERGDPELMFPAEVEVKRP